MNMQTPIEAATPDERGTSLALPANIADLVAGRDRAIELHVEARLTFHASAKAAALASIGGALHFGVPHDDRYSNVGMTRSFFNAVAHRTYDRDTRETTETSADEHYRNEVTAQIDRACWANLISKMGVDQLFDRQAREEFDKSMADTPPAFTVDNCVATIGHLLVNRRDMYLRGIANVFMQFDRRFRSHDAFAIGNRIVFSNALQTDYGSWNYGDRGKRDAFDDVERIFRELDGLGPIPHGQRISEQVAVSPAMRPYRIEGDYFKVDAYKNGNVHIWFTNKRLLAEVNKLLIEYYNPVEGDVGEGPTYEAGPLYHQTPAKNFGLFPSPPEVVAQVLSRAEILYSRDECANSGRDNWQPLRVLEPSAGTGSIARAVKAKGHDVECIEIQPGLAHELRRAGFHTREADFLTVKPEPIYDAVLMNPPFDRGRDCDHVRHAFQFLKPGGVLIAVMSARAEHATDKRHQALHDLIKQNDSRWGWVWRDLPERSFASTGTNVNTVTLRLQKKR